MKKEIYKLNTVDWNAVLEKELCCEFIRTVPDKHDFDIFKAINEIQRHFKKSSKEFSRRLLGLDFTSNDSVSQKL